MTTGKHGQCGFSYLWVLLTVAVLGVGMAVGADVYATSVQREREQALLDIGHEFRAAIASYRRVRTAGGDGEYPESLQDLLQDPRAPGTLRHLRRIYRDPMTGKAEWGEVRLAGRIVGVHSLADVAPFRRANFDPEDRAFTGRTSVREWVFTDPPDLMLRPLPAGNEEPAQDAAGLEAEAL